MGQITVEKNVAGIERLCVITPAVHVDNRGYFIEAYSRCDMEEDGIDIAFVQKNQLMSTKGNFVGSISRRTILKLNWLELLKGQYLMWPWIFEAEA